MRLRKAILTLVAGAWIGYLIAAAVVFDFTATVRSWDEEHRGGRPVSHGPRPRLSFRDPYHLDIPGGPDYSGDEWPFDVVAPNCDLWRLTQGHAKAHRCSRHR